MPKKQFSHVFLLFVLLLYTYSTFMHSGVSPVAQINILSKKAAMVFGLRLRLF